MRDPAQSLDQYSRFIAERIATNENAVRLGANTLFRVISERCFQLAVATYSSGGTVDDCLRWLNESVSYELRFIIETRQYNFVGFRTVDDYTELLAAASIVGRADELIGALRRCTYKEPPNALQLSLVNKLCQLLEGKSVGYDAGEAAALGKLSPDWGLLPALLKTVSDGNSVKFSAALDTYLVDGWGPPTDKVAKQALKSTPPNYSGKWCFLSAALCRIMRSVPTVSPKAKRYLPVDLIERLVAL